MPIYEYKCRNGHVFEAIQSMSEDPLTDCEECGSRVERVFHPVAVHFKGSGFYTTDYGSKKAAGDGKPEGGKESGEKGEGKAETKSDSGTKDSGTKASAKSD